MEVIAAVFVHILYSSGAAGFMIVLLLLGKKCFGYRLSGRVYHMMWLLVLVRLLMPCEIESPLSLGRLFPASLMTADLADYARSGVAGAPAVIDGRLQFTSPDRQEPHSCSVSSYSGQMYFFSRVWLAGAAVMVLLAVLAAGRLLRRRRAGSRIDDPRITEMVRQCCRRLGIKKIIPVYRDAGFKGPCITGLVNPRIYLPHDLGSRLQADQLEHVLLHELAHYQRKDLLCNLGALLAIILHWFNPLVWLAVREMRHDREIAADTYVMEVLGESAVIPYGNTLITLARVLPHGYDAFNRAGFRDSDRQMERRIIMLKRFKKGSYKLPALALLSFIIMGGLFLTVTGSVKPDADPALSVSQATVHGKTKGMLVVIDAGHGGEDWGATHPGFSDELTPVEVKEKDINLQIALRTSDLLQKQGIKVVMTREDDTYISLEQRAALANEHQARLLVSIHCGADFDSSPNGTRTIYCDGAVKADQAVSDQQLARIVQDCLVKELETADLGLTNIRRAKILEQTSMPAVIAHVAYITHEAERDKLQSDAFRNKAAQAIGAGIKEALEKLADAETEGQPAGRPAGVITSNFHDSGRTF